MVSISTVGLRARKRPLASLRTIRVSHVASDGLAAEAVQVLEGST